MFRLLAFFPRTLHAMTTVSGPYHLNRYQWGRCNGWNAKYVIHLMRQRDRRRSRKCHGLLLRMYVRPFLKDRLERSLLSLAQRTACR